MSGDQVHNPGASHDGAHVPFTPGASPVLVTGGAGYIGSHAVLALHEAGHRVVVLDDLSTGVRDLVPSFAEFIEGNAGDTALVEKILKAFDIRAVVHFAGSIVIADAIADPLEYYRNNIVVSRNLLEACVRAGVARMVYSSTAAVYGESQNAPITEETLPVPINPYGRSKLVVEWMLQDAAVAYGLRFVALRYFNVAGADPLGRTGQSGPQELLIKKASRLAAGHPGFIEVLGEDYDTPDGTSIRDFIHVTDLAVAHVAALRHLEEGGECLVLNCGYGHGYSVREVLSVVEQVSGRRLDIRSGPRRRGDPTSLVADAAQIRARFGWVPQFDDLEVIVKTALDWEKILADGRHVKQPA